MSSLDGKILKRVIRGDASRLFESVPSFRSSLSWSPDGKRLAFVAEAQSRDVIYVVAADKEGKVLRQHHLDFDAVVVPGVVAGRTTGSPSSGSRTGAATSTWWTSRTP